MWACAERHGHAHARCARRQARNTSAAEKQQRGTSGCSQPGRARVRRSGAACGDAGRFQVHAAMAHAAADACARAHTHTHTHTPPGWLPAPAVRCLGGSRCETFAVPSAASMVHGRPERPPPASQHLLRRWKHDSNTNTAAHTSAQGTATHKLAPTNKHTNIRTHTCSPGASLLSPQPMLVTRMKRFTPCNV
jgi:hypothetical protein